MKELLYGKHIIIEGLKKTGILKIIYMSKQDPEIIKLAKEKNIPLKIVSPQKMNDMFFRKNHQGVCAEAHPYPFIDLPILISNAFKKSDNPLFIIIDKITDPHNLGAIIRNAAAFNVEGIIIGKHKQAQISDTVHKVSAGATFNVDISQVVNINQTIDILKKNKFWIVGTSMNANQTIGELDKETPYGFVLGSEGEGISTLTSKLCDMNVKIPMSDKIDSLNVAVASGIMMYEFKK